MGESAVVAANRSWWKVAPLVLCLIIIVAIPLHFAFALFRSEVDLEPGSLGLMDSEPLLVALFLLVMTPLAILVGWRDFSGAMSVTARGPLAGFIFGLWALSCAIVIPYLGVYPVVWAAAIHGLVFGWESHGLTFWGTLYVLNLVVCPGVGLLFFQKMARWRQRLDLPVR